MTDPEHIHCWHWTGDVLTSNPPQYPRICCHCGMQRNVRALLDQTRQPSLHGRHVASLAIKQRQTYQRHAVMPQRPNPGNDPDPEGLL